MMQATVDTHGAVQDPRPAPNAGWLAVLLIVALAITLAGVFPFRQILAQTGQVEEAQAELTSLQDENARLQADAAALQTPAEIERVAREELGLVRPGETGYAVRQPDIRPTPDPEPSVVVEDERTWVDKLWDFLTGRDLAPDG